MTQVRSVRLYEEHFLKPKQMLSTTGLEAGRILAQSYWENLLKNNINKEFMELRNEKQVKGR